MVDAIEATERKPAPPPKTPPKEQPPKEAGISTGLLEELSEQAREPDQGRDVLETLAAAQSPKDLGNDKLQSFIPFERSGKGKSKVSDVSLKKEREVKGGAEGEKSLEDVSLRRGGRIREAGAYFRKIIDPEFLKQHPSLNTEKILAKYRELKDAGVPVVSTFRIHENEILMTDLSEKGQNLVYSENTEEEADQLEIVSKFQPNNFDSIRNELLLAAKRAAEAGYELRPDSYFLVISPEKKAQVIVGDLGLGVAKEPGFDVEFIANRNIAFAEDFYNKAMRVFGIEKFPPLNVEENK